MLLIAAALGEELETGMVLCQDQKKILSASLSLRQATRGGKTITFLKTGVGPKRSAASLKEALKVITPSQILVIGYAGALDPGLKLGSLVAVAKAASFSLDKNDPDWDHVRLEGEVELVHGADLARLAESAGISACAGSTLTSPYVLGDPERKRLLFEKFHATIVDMETAALAFIAAAKAIPISCVRVISDEANDTFLAPFSYDPSTNIPLRARKLLDNGMIKTYQEWKDHASVAKESLGRFLSYYL